MLPHFDRLAHLDCIVYGEFCSSGLTIPKCYQAITSLGNLFVPYERCLLRWILVLLRKELLEGQIVLL